MNQDQGILSKYPNVEVGNISHHTKFEPNRVYKHLNTNQQYFFGAVGKTAVVSFKHTKSHFKTATACFTRTDSSLDYTSFWSVLFSANILDAQQTSRPL